MIDKRINVQQAFNAGFCSKLEYHLGAAFSNLDDNELRSFWCDGIYEPLIYENFNSRNITSLKQLTTWAWLGPKGQDQYVMIIKLGRCSRRRALQGWDLSTCLPDAESFDWVDVDVLNKVITLQLK